MHDLNYTDEDHSTWRLFFQEFQQHVGKNQDFIHPFYLENLQVLDSFGEEIPTLRDINRLIEPIGWSAQYVDGYAPGWEIARMLNQKVIPISAKLRKPEEVFFAHEPDLIHDVFGHIPTLFSKEYCSLLKRWSSISAILPVQESDRSQFHLNKLIANEGQSVAQIDKLKQAASLVTAFMSKNPSPVYLADKAYFWIFEFGMLKDKDRAKVFGAGLMTSMNELNKIASGDYEVAPISYEKLLEESLISDMQNSYLLADDLSTLEASIDRISHSLMSLMGSHSYA